MSTVRLTPIDVTVKLNDLKKSPYVPNMFWNTNTPNTPNLKSVSSYPCGVNGYVCNSFGGGIQCFAFALHMANEVFGSYPEINESGLPENGILERDEWPIYTGTKCNDIHLTPGDIIRAEGHSAIVWKVYYDTTLHDNIVEVAEVWGNPPNNPEWRCKIAWGYFNGTNANKLETTLLAKAQYIVKAPVVPLSPPTGYNVEITFDACGGTCSTTSKTVTLGGKYGTLPVPTKAGYTFAGWWDEEYVEYDEYTADTTVTDSSITTLYAHWAKTYKITNVATGTCLNVYGDNVTSLTNGINVTLWTDSGTNEQKWVIAGTQRKRYIRSAIDTKFGLNVYRAGSPYNCNVYKIIGNETDARIDMVKNLKYGYYRIRLTEHDLYLTGDSAHGNVYWTEETGNDNQFWEIAEV